MIPARGLLLVRPVQTAETLGGSPIVLLDETRARWTGQQCEVIAIGEPEWCEDLETCERMNHVSVNLPHRFEPDVAHWMSFEVGDWLLVRPRCFVLTDEENVWACKQSDVLARLTLA